MRDALDDEIETYEAILPEIKREHGSVWALITGRKLVNTFKSFRDAAIYAREHFDNQPVLIRHTDSRKQESAPFIHVHSEG